MILDPTQLSAWRDLGYVNLGSLLEPEERSEIGLEYDRLVTLDGQTLGNPEEGILPARAMLSFRSPLLATFGLHPALLAVASQLLGDNMRPWWDQGINKKPGSGSFIGWHQDNGYESGQMPAYLTCWFALDDSNRENGGLEIIPGSHLSGQYRHTMEGIHAVIHASEVDTERAIPLDAAEGDVLLFSSLLVHQTVGNISADRDRRAWVMQYCLGDQMNEVTGEAFDNRTWAIRDGVFQTELQSDRRFDLRGDRPKTRS